MSQYKPQAARILLILSALGAIAALPSLACEPETDETVPIATAPVSAPPAASSALLEPEEHDGGTDADAIGAGGTGPKRPAGDPTGLAACCSALERNAALAPAEQKGAYLAAAGACNAARKNPSGRAVLAQVRRILRDASVPIACQ